MRQDFNSIIYYNHDSEPWRKFMQTSYGEITLRFLLIQYFELDLTISTPHLNWILVHCSEFYFVVPRYNEYKLFYLRVKL